MLRETLQSMTFERSDILKLKLDTLEEEDPFLSGRMRFVSAALSQKDTKTIDTLPIRCFLSATDLQSAAIKFFR